MMIEVRVWNERIERICEVWAFLGVGLGLWAGCGSGSLG